MPPLCIFDADLLIGYLVIGFRLIPAFLALFFDSSPEGEEDLSSVDLSSVYRCKFCDFYVPDRCFNASMSIDPQSFRVSALWRSPFLSRASTIFTMV